MTADSETETKYAELCKRIEGQARFTRTVVVVCTAAILGTIFYVLSEIFAALPGVIIANQLEKLEPMVYQWRALERKLDERAGGGASAESSSPSGQQPGDSP